MYNEFTKPHLKKKWLVSFSKTTANYRECNQTYQADYT